jgi:hypothetical protein
VAIGQFLAAILSDADLDRVNVEAGLSLVWTKGFLDVATPFSILPIPQADGVQPKLTSIVTVLSSGCDAVLKSAGPGLPDVDAKSARIRLRLKISTKYPENSVTDRTLLEIAAIDFPLPAPPVVSSTFLQRLWAWLTFRIFRPTPASSAG